MRYRLIGSCVRVEEPVGCESISRRGLARRKREREAARARRELARERARESVESSREESARGRGGKREREAVGWRERSIDRGTEREQSEAQAHQLQMAAKLSYFVLCGAEAKSAFAEAEACGCWCYSETLLSKTGKQNETRCSASEPRRVRQYQNKNHHHESSQ